MWLARIHRKVLAVKICSQYTTKNLDLLKTWPHARESVSKDDVSELNAPKEIIMVRDYFKYLESENRLGLLCESHFYSDTLIVFFVTCVQRHSVEQLL